MVDVLPTGLQVLLKLSRDVTTSLFHIVHDVRLVHHVPLAEGYEFLQLVCEQLAAYVYSAWPVSTSNGTW